ncbi:MAG: translocation/assembly module TamB domain-containing protein [Bacillota bacterium]
MQLRFLQSKKLILGLIILVLLVSGFYFNANQILSKMKDSLISELENRLDTNIKVESIGISGLTSISAYDIVIKDDKNQDLMQAEELVINYGVLDLLTKYSEPLNSIKDIEFNAPQINLVQNENWNYNFLLSSAPQQNTKKQELFPVYINNGDLQIKSDELEEKVSQINGLIDLRDGVAMFLDGKLEGLTSKLETKVIIDEQNYQGEVQFSNLNLSNLTNKSNLNLPKDLKANGALTGGVKFKGDFGELDSFYGDLFLQEGKIDYKGLEVEGIKGDFAVNDYGVKVNNVKANYENNLVTLNGSIFGWKEPQLNLSYQIDELDLDIAEEFLNEEISTSGQADIVGQIEGTIDQPTVKSQMTLEQINVAQETIKNIKAGLYYKAGILNLENLDLDYKQGSINADGTFDFNQSFNYIVNADVDKLDLDDIELDFLSKLGLKGIANGQAIVSGTGWNKEKLNMLGSLNVNSGAVKNYEFSDFSSRFWLNEEKIFLNDTKLKGAIGEGFANGMLTLDGDLNLDLQLNNLSVAELKEIEQLKDVTGQVDVLGNLSGSINNPKLKAQVKGADLKYKNIDIGDLNSEINFANRELEIKDAEFPNYSSKLSGTMNFGEKRSNIEIITDDLKADKVGSLIDKKLDLSGDLAAKTKITSLLSDPIIKSELQITNGKLLGKQKFDDLKANLDYDLQEDKLKVQQGEINYNQSELQLAGTMIEQELDFDFNSSNLIWKDINFTEQLEQLTGKAEADGSIYGKLEDPKVATKLDTENVQFSEKDIGAVNGRIDYRDHNIYMTDISVKSENNDYQLNGSFNLEQNEINKIDLEVTTGTTDYLKQFLPYDIDRSYQFNGELEAQGSLEKPKFNTELTIYDNDDQGNLEVKGDYVWDEEADLKLAATKFDIGVINQFDLLPYQVGGSLNLNGELTGKLTALNLNSNLKLTEGTIANLNYKRLAGTVKMIDGEKIILDQELEGEEENIIQAIGEIPLAKDQKFDLDLSLDEGNLRVLSLLIPEIRSAKGKGNANLKISGPLEKPKVVGESEVIAGSFSHPILDRKISNFNGELDFIDNKVLLKDINGQYGDGSFEGEGSISLKGLTPAKYDIEFSGQKIAFEHGSWRGLNDAEIMIAGSGTEPQIEGTIEAYDTQFQLPVDWPSFKEDGAKEDGAKGVSPQVDLEVEPKNNVRVGNDRIDILVQQGSLNLRTIDDKIRLIGELSSNQGRFTYYNTEFELQEGKAIFRQYDYMPNLQIEATTDVYDRANVENNNQLSEPYHEITLNLTGPADELTYQLSSDSNLSEERIISLLTGQGGLGNLLDKDYEQALTSELRRVIGEGIKTEVIYKVERSFEESLDLDQVRIKSLLESDDSVEVELGKYIFNNFMLKYNHSFLDEDKNIGFEYYFNQGLENLMIQGNYDSEGEYEIGLEASIPFE